MLSNLRGPLYVQVEITSDCNNRCLHCYNFWRYEESKPKKLSINEWREVAKILGKNDIFYATITGGEPFLAKEEMYEMLNVLKEQNIGIMINSNATLIDKVEAERLAGYPLEVFLVSLISHNPKTHNKISRSKTAFQKTVEGIQNLKEQNISLAINMVANKLNHAEVYDTGKWVYQQFGINNFSATPVCPSVKDHEWLELNEEQVFSVLNQLLRLKKEFNTSVDILEVFPTCLFTDSPKEIQEIFSKRMCTAGNTTLTIGSEGNIRVCSYDQESYGNILEEDFKTIWKKMEKWRDNSLLPKECKDCIIVDSCGGGCKVSNNVKKGDYCELSDFYKGAIKDRQKTFFQELTSDFDLNQKYRIVNKITLREEQKNIFTLAVNPMYFIIVNETGLDIIKHLQKSGSFVPSKTIKELNIEKEKGKSFFSELYNKGFINLNLQGEKNG